MRLKRRASVMTKIANKPFAPTSWKKLLRPFNGQPMEHFHVTRQVIALQFESRYAHPIHQRGYIYKQLIPTLCSQNLFSFKKKVKHVGSWSNDQEPVIVDNACLRIPWLTCLWRKLKPCPVLSQRCATFSRTSRAFWLQTSIWMTDKHPLPPSRSWIINKTPLYGGLIS